MMSKKVETYGQIINGKIHYTKVDEFKKSVMINFREGERFKVIYEKIYRKRSSQQNRYYFGCIVPEYIAGIEGVNGYEYCEEFTNRLTGEIIHLKLTNKEKIEKAHKELKEMFNFSEDEYGNIIPRSTTENSTSQAMDFFEEIRRFAKEFLNHYIPLPGEQKEINL